MAKRKLFRFDEMKSFKCVFEPTIDDCKNDTFPLKANWKKDYFKNDNPIILELGCGKGEYTIGLAKRHPNINFIGVDIKGARMWYGATTAVHENISNVAFLRTRIDFIDKFFGKNEVDEIWLTFSDPQPKKPNKRLSSRHFIDLYKKFLVPHGVIHLKTDSDLLFESTLEEIVTHNYQMLVKTWDLYAESSGINDASVFEAIQIQTYYETLFSAKGFKIKYCKFLVD